MKHPSGLLTVDLDAVKTNWLRLRDTLTAGTECSAVVKANAYGLGMAPVSRALWQAGCRTFFVVNLSEGQALRRTLGAGATIYLLQGVRRGEEADCIAAQLIPVLVTRGMAERWGHFCSEQGVPAEQRRSALKINTGMNRLGLDLPDFEALLARPSGLAELGCGLLMSHLACADEPGHPLNQQQLRVFTEAAARARHIHRSIRTSLANSAATLQGEDWHFDLVRPGIALYGSNPTGLAEHAMTSVVDLQLPVAQVRRVSAGAAIGYGATYTAERDRHLVTISGGYGDGVFRSLGNRGHIWFNARCPLVGRVSMDSLIADATELSEVQRPGEGDRVEVLGPHVTIDEAAYAAGTIAYEVLTRLDGRYDRLYKLGGRPLDASEVSE